MLRKLVPLVALALAAAACSADTITAPGAKTSHAQARYTGGMMGGGG